MRLSRALAADNEIHSPRLLTTNPRSFDPGWCPARERSTAVCKTLSLLSPCADIKRRERVSNARLGRVQATDQLLFIAVAYCCGILDVWK